MCEAKKVMSLCLINYALCHEDTRVLDGGDWSASRLGRLTPSTHWTGGWVSPRAGLDTGENIIYLNCRESNQGRPASTPSRYRLFYDNGDEHLGSITMVVLKRQYHKHTTLCLIYNITIFYYLKQSVWGSGCIDPHFP
jgi:hypothetical protein